MKVQREKIDWFILFLKQKSNNHKFVNSYSDFELNFSLPFPSLFFYVTSYYFLYIAEEMFYHKIELLLNVFFLL